MSSHSYPSPVITNLTPRAQDPGRLSEIQIGLGAEWRRCTALPAAQRNPGVGLGVNHRPVDQPLGKSTVLRPRAGYHLVLTSDGGVTARGAGATRQIPDGLAILGAFSPPCSFEEGLARLKPRIAGIEDWKRCATAILDLHSVGALESPEPRRTILARGNEAGFGAASSHISMLNDCVRTSAFLEGVARTVRPGDVVVDLGTGTGVLAIAAANAGARKVYAIEASDVADVAAEMFRVNDPRGRIELIRDWSTGVSLPERADVLLCETISNDAFKGEGFLELARDAKRRLLQPQARLVPRGIRVYAIPVTLSPELASRWVFGAGDVSNWQTWYGIDCSPLLDAAARTEMVQATWKPGRGPGWEPLAPPGMLLELNLEQEAPINIDAHVRCTAHRAGLLNGAVLFFELEVTEGRWISTHPDAPNRASSWANPVYVSPARALTQGAAVDLRFTYAIADVGDGVHL